MKLIRKIISSQSDSNKLRTSDFIFTQCCIRIVSHVSIIPSKCAEEILSAEIAYKLNKWEQYWEKYEITTHSTI